MKLSSSVLKIILLCSLQILAGGASAFAAPAAVKPETALRQAFPQLEFSSIEPSEISGLYEVVSGQNILYFHPEKEYIIVGEIFNKEEKNITAEKRQALAQRLMKQSEELVKDIPLDKAVKIGSGKNVVIEFTDPDCPFCKKASEFLKNRTDVTRYIFFAPFAHPAAIEKVHYILSADDKGKAYAEMMRDNSSAPQGKVYDESVKALAQEHLALAMKVGIDGTPTFFINGAMVVGADMERIEQLLGGN